MGDPGGKVMKTSPWEWRPSLQAWTRHIPLLAYAAVLSNARYFLRHTSGVLAFLVAGAMLLSALLLLKEVATLLARGLGRTLRLRWFPPVVLVGSSVMLAFVLIEAALQVSTWFQKPEDRAGLLAGLTMPAAWERRPAEVEGMKHAYYWHNVLHVHNREGMRIVGEFPPKRPGTFRVIVLGDSLTYGYGIAEKDTYPRVLEKLLGEAFRVDVANLGVSGAQSEDISRILRRQLPDLRPELVIYGVCLNDFLPSGVGEYDNNRAYQVPLPYKDHFIAATLTGKLLEKQYDALLIRLGLRVDFFTDILKDFDGYQTRFARDVKAMNAFVRGHGLPPMVAMVLDQSPSTREKRYAIVQAAERHLREAGIRLIPSDYIQRNDGRKDWKVSPWEGHPNEKANRVFALEFAGVLRELPELQAYGHGAGDRAGLGHAGPPPGRGPGTGERSGAPAPGTG